MIHIYQHGGIGDQIVGLPFIQQFLGRDTGVTLYTKFPEIARIFLPWVEIKTREELDRNRQEWFIDLIDVVKFVVNVPKPRFPRFMVGLYDAYNANRAIWGDIIDRHPSSCNELGKMAVSYGAHRWDLAFRLINQPYRQFEFDFPHLEKVEDFITVHDGFDASHNHDVSTKTWNVDYWSEFVRLFKQRYPNIAVIQLGGKRHHVIQGTDENLAGQLPFEQSLRYLRNARLHVDGDSGLVHARHLFAKPSIVLFGPTNARYFGYPENLNIQTPFLCKECWWKKSEWMKVCIEGYPMDKAPACMNAIRPEYVTEQAARLIDGMQLL